MVGGEILEKYKRISIQDKRKRYNVHDTVR